MSERACPHEPAVVEAARTRQWVQGLEAHVNTCPECADAMRVTAWLRDVAARLGRDRSAPDATYIWLRAEIEKQKRARDTDVVSWRRLSAAALPGLAVGLVSAAAIVAVLPGLAVAGAAARSWLSRAFAEASLVDMTVIGTVWLGLPLLLAATYLLVLRPLR